MLAASYFSKHSSTLNKILEMIHFEIEFLICFLKITTLEIKGPKTKVSKESKSHKNVKRSVKTHDSGLINTTLDQGVHSTLQGCHIEYCLLEHVLPVVEINVVTWGSGATVFVKDHCQSVNPTVIDDVVWVNFTMAHKITELENDDIIKFKNSTITFTISQKQGNGMSNFSNGWKNQFKITKKSVDILNATEKHFSDVHGNSLSNGTPGYCDSESMEDVYKMSRPDKNNIVSLLQILPLTEKNKIKIQDISPTLNNIREYPRIGVDISTKVKKKKNNFKDKKKIKSGIEATKLCLKSELMLAEKTDICVEQKILDKNIKYVAVFIKSSKILTEKQNMLFLPLIINIKAAEDLPLSFLEKLNVKSFYAQYELANILKSIETDKFPLGGKDMFMNDTKVFFLSGPEENGHLDRIKPSLLKFQEALLTRRMVVKLYGEVSLDEPSTEACLFGNNIYDEFISLPGHEIFVKYQSPIKQGTMFLGSSCFKLIQLLDGYTTLEMSSVLTSTSVSTWDPVCDWKLLIEEPWKGKEAQDLLNKWYLKGQIPDSVFLKTCTRFTISVSSPCTFSQLSWNDQLLIPNIFHRCILVLQSKELAYKAFKTVESNNNRYICSMNVLMPHKNTSRMFNDDIDINDLKSCLIEDLINQFHNFSLNNTWKVSEQSHSNEIITGFFLDNNQECIMVLEGTPSILSNTIDVLTSMISSKDGKIIYDSTLFFTQRLYYDFFPALNIFYIQLKTPLQILLKQAHHYLTENLPEPSVQALLRMDMLRRSPTLCCVTVNQLFPSYEQLISFNTLFGVTVKEGDLV